MPNYTDGSAIQLIAEPLIAKHHTHLNDLRIRMKYVFSDQEPETRGKRIFGDVKIINNLNAHLAEKDDDTDYGVPTFVCCKCKAWTLPEHEAELEANEDFFALCQTCYDEVVEWDFSNNANIAKLTGWREMAKQKQDGGFEVSSTNAFFCITVHRTYFDQAGETARKAFINHLLCHCGAGKDRSGETKLFKRPHDIEEYQLNVDLFGVDWRADLRNFAEACAKAKQSPQLTLIDENTPREEPEDLHEADAAAQEKAA